MKRLVLISLMTIVAMMAYAKPPQISVEQFFDGRYNNEKTVNTFISKDNGMYFRTLHVNDNPAIVKKIYDTLTKDAKHADKSIEQTGEGGRSTLMKIKNNGETIDIGFQQDPAGKSATLFIKGPEKAFK